MVLRQKPGRLGKRPKGLRCVSGSCQGDETKAFVMLKSYCLKSATGATLEVN